MNIDKTMRLGSFISEFSKRNKEDRDLPVYSVTNDRGFCTEYFSKEVASKDRTTYKIVPRGCFAYNPSRINVGSIDCQNCEDEVIVSPLYVVFSVSDDLDKQYLLYYLKSDISKAFIRALATGSVRDNLKFTTLQDFPIEIRSLDEQKEIVKKLDKISELILLRKEELKQFDELVKSQFIEMFEGKFDTLKIGEVFRTTSGGTPSKSRLEYYKNGTIPWLSSGEVNKGIIYTVKNYITQEGVDNSSAKMVPENSVVIAMYGATAGQVGLLRIPTTTNQAVCSVLPDSRYIPEYLYYAIKSKKDWMISQCAGGAQPNISQGVIKRMEIVNAPYELQKEFAAFVEQTDKSKFRIKESLENLENCYKALLQKYFG